MLQIGSGLEIVGLLYVAYQLYIRASARTLPDECGLSVASSFIERNWDVSAMPCAPSGRGT